MTGALRTLLTGLIDYAGLFAPAALPMTDAVGNYASYRDGADAWALARFVVPVVRLGEFEAAATPHLGGAPWRLTVLAQASDADTIRSFNARHAGRAQIEAVESAVTTLDDAGLVMRLAPADEAYVEVPVGEDPAPFIEVLAVHGLRAKIRTGGVVAPSFPSPAHVARFLAACAHHRVAFKATAGLHHPLRGTYPFTYDAGSARGEMFGYLNVFVAAAFARTGMSLDEVTRLLDERDPAAFRFTDTTFSWRGHRRSVAELAATREQFALSFGSCSFREPLDDLSALVLS